MKNKINCFLISLLLLFCIQTNAYSDEVNTQNAIIEKTVQEAQVPVGTPLKIRFKYKLSSDELKKGDTVLFEIKNDVVVGSTLIFKAGSEGEAIVTKSYTAVCKGKLEITEATVKDTLGKMHKINLSIKKASGIGVFACLSMNYEMLAHQKGTVYIPESLVFDVTTLD